MSFAKRHQNSQIIKKKDSVESHDRFVLKEHGINLKKKSVY